jgi:hypothetical protein
VDAVTTFTTAADVRVGGTTVPAGAYTLYVHAPADGDWALVLNRDPGQLPSDAAPESSAPRWPRIGDYSAIAEQEAARVAMRRLPPSSPAEMFTIALAPADPGATLTLSWGDRAYAVDLRPAPVAPSADARPKVPRGNVTGTVGGKSVTIDYGRPALKGRTIDALLAKLPEDRMWRAGEDQVTTLTTAGPLLIAGKRIPAGTFSLYVHVPTSGPWALVLNTDKGVPLGTIFAAAPPKLKDAPWPHIRDYQKSIAATEVLRAPMATVAVKRPVDVFTIDLAPEGKGSALTLSWGDRSWSLPIEPAS